MHSLINQDLNQLQEVDIGFNIWTSTFKFILSIMGPKFEFLNFIKYKEMEWDLKTK